MTAILYIVYVAIAWGFLGLAIGPFVGAVLRKRSEELR